MLFRSTAVPWEFLAFVKLRAVGGDSRLGDRIEAETRTIIHRRAIELPTSVLAAETRRVRTALEESRGRRPRSNDVDIKYAPGGLLDIYFVTRYLQLRDNVPDEGTDRSTLGMITRLLQAGSIGRDAADELAAGYEMLARLDHSEIGRAHV